MNGNFKVGEVCIGQNYVLDVDLNGTECIIIGALMTRRNNQLGRTAYYPVYVVEWANGSHLTHVKPTHLRRKQPPTGEASILNMFVVASPKRMKEEA